MFVVTVEVWPGGRMLARKVIGTLTLANVSKLADVSNYEGYLDAEPIEVEGHTRSDGPWRLIKKAIEVSEHVKSCT